MTDNPCAGPDLPSQEQALSPMRCILGTIPPITDEEVIACDAAIAVLSTTRHATLTLDDWSLAQCYYFGKNIQFGIGLEVGCADTMGRYAAYTKGNRETERAMRPYRSAEIARNCDAREKTVDKMKEIGS